MSGSYCRCCQFRLCYEKWTLPAGEWNLFYLINKNEWRLADGFCIVVSMCILHASSRATASLDHTDHSCTLVSQSDSHCTSSSCLSLASARSMQDLDNWKLHAHVWVISDHRTESEFSSWDLGCFTIDEWPSAIVDTVYAIHLSRVSVSAKNCICESLCARIVE